MLTKLAVTPFACLAFTFVTVAQTACGGYQELHSTATLDLSGPTLLGNGAIPTATGSISIPYFDTLGGSRVLTHAFLDLRYDSSVTIRYQNPSTASILLAVAAYSEVWFDSAFGSDLAWSGQQLTWEIAPSAALDAVYSGWGSYGPIVGLDIAALSGVGDFSADLRYDLFQHDSWVPYVNGQAADDPYDVPAWLLSAHVDVETVVTYVYEEVQVVPLPTTAWLGAVGLMGLSTIRRRGLR